MADIRTAPSAILACAIAVSVICVAALSGCKAMPTPAAPKATSTQAVPTYPARPTTTPATLKLFHQNASSITLVVPETTTDDQLAALVWQLRDTAQAHAFDALHIPQKVVDARDPKLWFHIYRGSKCAAEKYAAGPPPCGGSYHAAADFTVGSFKDPNRTEGVLLKDEDHETELWNPTL